MVVEKRMLTNEQRRWKAMSMGNLVVFFRRWKPAPKRESAWKGCQWAPSHFVSSGGGEHGT